MRPPDAAPDPGRRAVPCERPYAGAKLAGMASDEPTPAATLAVRDLTRHYQLGGHRVDVLNGVDLTLARGERLVVTGPSGCGKSTLLHILGTLDPPSSGSVRLDGIDPFALDEPELARFRNRNVGFVFQDHHLLPQYSVVENVLLVALAAPAPDPALEERARELLVRVGLGHRLEHRPAELSGGERQRVAIARALVASPKLVLCDEPTGNLDPRIAGEVAELLFELHRRERTILIVVTHSAELAGRFERRAALSDGRLNEG